MREAYVEDERAGVLFPLQAASRRADATTASIWGRLVFQRHRNGRTVELLTFVPTHRSPPQSQRHKASAMEAGFPVNHGVTLILDN